MGFDVTMEVAGFVEVEEALDDLGEDLGGFLEGEHLAGLLGLEVEQVATITILADEILVVLILLRVIQLHNIW